MPGGFIKIFRILHVVGDHLFFSSTHREEDTCALWVSDGARWHTLLKSVCLDDFSMMPVGKLFFTVDVPGSGWEQKSDTLVTQLVQTGFTYGRDASRPRLLVGDRGILYFNVHDNEGCALWRSDGTATGTAPLHRGCPQELVSVNGTLFFILSRQEPSIELWKSDGTAAGTIPVKVIP
jgi:ELWxxDGT repeat protein